MFLRSFIEVGTTKPKCGAFDKAQWLARQEVKLLPIPCFHVVFTTDHAINALAQVNKREIYNLLFRTAAKTLKAYARKYLGGEIGFTVVLHTWGQDMSEHIHLHCIVTGGGVAADGGRGTLAAVQEGVSVPHFLLHVLPSRFVRIRHYGLHHISKRSALERSRTLLGLRAELPEPPRLVMSEWVESFLGQDPRLCPFCEQGRMFRYRDFEPVSPTKSVILSVLGIPTRGQVVG